MQRELKHYIWIFEDKEVTLVDKRKNATMTLKMDKVDSLVRAYISFKTRHRIELCRELRVRLKEQRKIYRERVKKLKEKKRQGYLIGR